MGGQWPRGPRLLAPTGNIGGPQPHDRVVPKASNTHVRALTSPMEKSCAVVVMQIHYADARRSCQRRRNISKKLIGHLPMLTLGTNLAHEQLQGMAQMPLTQIQLGGGKRLRTAFTRPPSLSHTPRGGDPGRMARDVSQSACDLLV